MAVELAEVAAGLPMAASLALASGINTFRQGRRRTALNEAMHELRRPLQVLSLTLPDRLRGDAAVESSLRLAAAALERLDREVNGAPGPAGPAAADPRPLLEAAVERWRAAAARRRGRVSLLWEAGEAVVWVHPVGLSQAVDNLLNNALEHGGPEVAVSVAVEGRFLAIAVRDRGGRAVGIDGPRLPGGDPRRGHGLRVVRRFAASHGGSFELRRAEGGAEAILRLPLLEGWGR
ncbi:MAG: sensor histidine kinase [Nitrososphaerota archaeon]